MKRYVNGVLLWLAVVGTIAMSALRWPLVFWLLALSVCLYLVFGRRGELELRLGVGTRRLQKRLYAAVIWQRHAKIGVAPGVEGPPRMDRVE